MVGYRKIKEDIKYYLDITIWRSITMNSKDIFLASEGDAYFERNITIYENGSISKGISLFDNFIDKNHIMKAKILEIGCCSGNNLVHFYKKYNFEGYGIEPSTEAVEYGNSCMKEHGISDMIKLYKGTSDELPFQNSEFDIVYIGFCLFWIDRSFLFKTISEVDRVLKTGGYIFLEDFDTSIPYKRVNKHNPDAFTYKLDYTKIILSDPRYYLCEKTSYSHENMKFSFDTQNRVASYILYKDNIDSCYCFD